MRKPFQDVRVLSIQDRRASERVKRPWVVRWKVDGILRSKSFRTRGEADRYRSLLLRAHHDGEPFDEATGAPTSWLAPEVDRTVYKWTRKWLADQWPEWAPRTRMSGTEALSRLVAFATDEPPHSGVDSLWKYATKALRPDRSGVDGDWEDWLRDHSLRLSDLTRVNVGEVDRRLTLRADGTPLAATTANRPRIVSRACVNGAIDNGLIVGEVWPRRSASRARRKVARVQKGVDIRQLPDPPTMARAIAAKANDKPGSRTYQVMTAVAYYAGLRPSEVVKTGRRSVPIPPVLVAALTDWIVERSIASDDALLFRTATDTRPNQQNWNRAWHRALALIGRPPLRVYDCRHAAATTWLRSGVPLAETARRMGHSVETLVTNYVGALTDEEEVANQKIDAMFESSNPEEPKDED